MMHTTPAPIAPKTYYYGMLSDSRRWRHFTPRDGDIVIATPPKSGTTWFQGITALLLSGDPDVNANPTQKSPWLDNRNNEIEDVLGRLNAQTERRNIKTHTPLDGIPIWPQVRYVCIYRHPIDVHFSSRTHVANYRPEVAERLGITEDTYPSDPRDSFHLFLERDDLDHGSLRTIVTHYLKCMELEVHENVLRLHYADMTRDLETQMAGIATHLDVAHSDTVIDELVDAAAFANMKANAGRFGLAFGKEFWRNDTGFFDSASSNKWEGVLTEADLAAYDKAISKLVTPSQRQWLEWGGSA